MYTHPDVYITCETECVFCEQAGNTMPHRTFTTYPANTGRQPDASLMLGRQGGPTLNQYQWLNDYCMLACCVRTPALPTLCSSRHAN